MKSKNTDPMKRFLKKHPFLAETERVYRLVDAAVGPSAVGQTDGVDVEEVPVFRGRHPGRLLAA